MKKTELRKMLKPLVRQCVKEVLLEEGVLSNIVSEVVTGFSPMLVENKTTNQTSETSQQELLLQQQRAELEEEKRRMMKEHKRKLLDATGFGSEIFEGVQPLSKGGAVDEPASTGALAGVDPSDPGVDISGIMALSGKKWNKLV
tara:strand:+ start:508 stop:939 length:432 start_codon:yes stop_codon:yes gene_type:complete